MCVPSRPALPARSFPDSWIGRMFSHRWSLPRDTEGCIFVDRNPTHFKFALWILQNPTTTSSSELSALLGEDCDVALVNKELEWCGVYPALQVRDE
jgi:hypothetical protein